MDSIFDEHPSEDTCSVGYDLHSAWVFAFFASSCDYIKLFMDEFLVEEEEI
jgi:hypothetical protein